MGTKQPAKVETKVAEPAAPATKPEIRYVVVAPKRPLTGKKFGVSGNEFTHAKLAEAAKARGGSLTYTEVQAVCNEANHKGFARYALNRLKILQPAQ